MHVLCGGEKQARKWEKDNQMDKINGKDQGICFQTP
jgi:hypothetical protein